MCWKRFKMSRYILYFISNTLTTLNCINNHTLGRDKVARLVQYSSRMVRDQLEYRSADKFTLERLRYIEHAAGQFRRLMRMGRCFETAHAALHALKDIEDPVHKLTITIRKMAISLFLYCDHLIWLIRHSFMAGDCEKWYNRANQFWLLSIVAGLCRDLYDITIAYERHLILCKKRGYFKSSIYANCNLFRRTLANLHFLMFLHIDLILDVVRNTCDVFIPLASLGFINLNATTVGILGGIASIVGLFQIVHPEYRVSPV